MIKFAPIIIAVFYAFIVWWFSSWRTAKVLNKGSALLTDKDLLSYTQKMAQTLDLAEIQVYIFESDAVNGLARHDGQIFLTRGFINRKLAGEISAEELASVVAHELGHVALGHSRRRMIDFSGQNAVFIMLSVLLSRFFPFGGMMIAKLLSSLLMARLSRRDEFEADAYASALLIKTGIGTESQKSLFRKLDKITDKLIGTTPAWLMSHPRPRDRIAAIERNEAHWKNR